MATPGTERRCGIATVQSELGSRSRRHLFEYRRPSCLEPCVGCPRLPERAFTRLLFTAHPQGNYGYGWFIETQPRRKIYHAGGDPGFAAFELRYPDQKLVIVVLANEDEAPVRDIANTLAERILTGTE